MATDAETIVSQLKRRAKGCFLCAWILEDLAQNGGLTGYPTNPALEEDVFPVGSKILHMRLEKIVGPDADIRNIF